MSAWTARRGLRATEEALAAAGAALLAVDLGGARRTRAVPFGGRLPAPVRPASFAVVLLVALALGRATRSTATWPLVALLAAQPLTFLLLPLDMLTGPAGVAAALLLGGADLLAARLLRRGLRLVATVLAAIAASLGVLAGLATAVGLGRFRIVDGDRSPSDCRRDSRRVLQHSAAAAAALPPSSRRDRCRNRRSRSPSRC